MTRIRKAPEERRREIIATALQIFTERGYTQTTVMDICKAIGIAKGTFFYHFVTKDDVLIAVMKQEADRFARELNEACRGRNGLERLKLILQALQSEWPLENIMDKSDSEDSDFCGKFWQRTVSRVVNPSLEEAMLMGLQEGSMHFAVAELAERKRFFWAVMDYLWYVPAGMVSDDIKDEAMERRSALACGQLEKLFGLEAGKVKLFA